MEKRVAELEDSMMRVKRLYKIEREKLSSEGALSKSFTDSVNIERHEIESILGEITFEKDAFWRHEAARWLIEIPDDDSMVTCAEGFGEMKFLTDKAIAKIHRSIKLDQQENWKFIATIVSTIVSLAIGLIGSTIALLSFLSKR
jgi:hypothetical protein